MKFIDKDGGNYVGCPEPMLVQRRINQWYFSIGRRGAF
jgi:hypothetical protein